MEQKSFPLINKGMNRDLSISKAGESSAYTNKNIRIEARDNDTMLSVTNERGTSQISFASGPATITGRPVGWNVLNNHIVVFTTQTVYVPFEEPYTVDRIYRVDYSGSSFTNTLLFTGDLGFDREYPIESVVHFETEDIQKIYWIDGLHVLRFMNFMATTRTVTISGQLTDVYPWQDNNGDFIEGYFDSNKQPQYTAKASISKDNSGNSRPNGTAQYMLTYFNKHGQETGIAWTSDLVYLSPIGHGGAADSTNNNKVFIKLTNLDTSFDHFRIYSLLRSSKDGVITSYIVSESETGAGTATVIDDFTNQTPVDATSLLYVGSKNVKAGTLTHKDETLFLGDLRSIGNQYNAELKTIITENCFEDNGWEASDDCISFQYSSNSNLETVAKDIPYVEKEGIYPYNNQLEYTSSNITTFKGGEKYRFALKFRFADGSETDAIWIGDKKNDKYPQVVTGLKNTLRRVVVKFTLPDALKTYIQNSANNVKTIQLLVAEATYSDRLVLAQGLVNPTMFNVWERYNDRLYACPSWISRPRNSGFSSRHFESVKKSISKYGEIECNYWSTTEKSKHPYYMYFGYDTEAIHYSEKFEGIPTSEYWFIVYKVKYEYKELQDRYTLTAYIYAGASDSEHLTDMKKAKLNVHESKNGTGYSIRYIGSTSKMYYGADAVAKVYSYMKDYTNERFGVPARVFVPENTFNAWCSYAKNHRDWYDWVLQNTTYRLSSGDFSSNVFNTEEAATNVQDSGQTSTEASPSRWINTSTSTSVSGLGPMKPSYYKKHLVFVDENVVTLDSPEIAYGTFNFDNADYKFRIVGVARFDSVLSDYTVDASHGKLIGENMSTENFSAGIGSDDIAGLISAPLWNEYGLMPVEGKENTSPDDMTPADYQYGGGMVRYWLHMWNRAGHIDGYISDEGDYSVLNHKKFANLRFSYDTKYADNPVVFSTIDALRQFNYTSSQFVELNIGTDKRYYNGVVQQALDMPGDMKYPIIYSENTTEMDTESDKYYLKTDSPVLIEYSTNPHAVIALHSELDNDIYSQEILPRLNSNSLNPDIFIPTRDTSECDTGALLPWIDEHITFDKNILVIDIDEIAEQAFVPTITYDDNDEPIYGEFYTQWEQGSEGDSIISHTIYAFWDYLGSDKSYMRIKGTDSYYYLVELLSCSGNGDATTIKGNIIAKCSTTGDARYDQKGVVYYTDEVVSTASAFGQLSMGLCEYCIRLNTFHDLEDYDFTDYAVSQANLTVSGVDASSDEYLFIGELYRYGDKDSDYGGVSEAAIQNNKFIPAGPVYNIVSGLNYIIGNQGDTFFQRWDSVRTKPYSNDSVNQVVDIASFLVETHINIDGRTDVQRGTSKLASLDLENIGNVNNVYSQADNFIISRDLDSDFDADSYRASLTWTLPKTDSALVDEWTHITLASSLKLDGDKGNIQALRRFGNSIYAFQDKGIAEILFNSRTQLSTTDGVPVEIANSGKVDGKRYITNKYGCVNKWSIVEGKAALYFIDNINKAFCAINGDGIKNVSADKGFSVAFRRINNIKSWNSRYWDNVVSYFDRIHSDVYLVGPFEDGDCLVYNEALDAFTSYFDYYHATMMVNVDDKFIASNIGAGGVTNMWLMNEGYYGDFFGTYKPFSVEYRVTPNPYSDKIWTNIEYRADVYDVTVNDDDESALLDGDLLTQAGKYKPNDTFDSISLKNEYQISDDENAPDLKKKFRIWRYVIPRAKKTATNQFGLDRMRSPWVNIKFKKNSSVSTKNDLMQMHDFIINYFE